MKIIAIDFDGTIVHNRFPQIGPPMLGAIDTIKQLMNISYVKLILWTVRDGDHLTGAIDWLESKGVVFDCVNKNINALSSSPKVYAHYYIDDMACCAPTWRDGRAIYLDWDKIREDIEEKFVIKFNQ